MSRWCPVVRRELARYRDETGTDVLKRQEFLEFALPVFRGEFPERTRPGRRSAGRCRPCETREWW